jgi:hypothetical protein
MLVHVAKLTCAAATTALQSSNINTRQSTGSVLLLFVMLSAAAQTPSNMRLVAFCGCCAYGCRTGASSCSNNGSGDSSSSEWAWEHQSLLWSKDAVLPMQRFMLRMMADKQIPMPGDVQLLTGGPPCQVRQYERLLV